MAGFIDDHRHLIQGRTPEAVTKFMKDDASARMEELLEAGFTTVQSGGDDNQGILQLKKMVETGEIKGPRILASGGVPTARLKSEAEVRAAVDKVVKDGADSIAEVHYPDMVWPYNPTIQETKNLAAGIDEAKKLGVEFQVHAVSDQAMIACAIPGRQETGALHQHQLGVGGRGQGSGRGWRAGRLHHRLRFAQFRCLQP